MKILLVTDLYPIGDSGEPVTIKNFAKKWQEAGHTVDVIRPNFLLNTIIRKKTILPEKIYCEDNITIYNLNFLTPFFFNVKNKLPEDFYIGSYNLVVSHMPSGALMALKLLGKCGGIPLAVSVHTSDITVLTRPLYKLYFAPALRKAYKRADAISARSFMLSEKIKELSEYAVNKTFIAPSGINSDIIEPQEFFEQKAVKSKKPFIITTTAKLIKRKNIDIIIKALAKIKNTDFIFRIMGDGAEKENLQNLAKQLNISDKIIFEGYIPNIEVLNILSQSDLFILLSENETFGLSYLEAAARANIVIATKNDGIDGIIQDGVTGFTCNPDENELANLIDNVMNLSEENIRNILLNQRKYLIDNDEVKVSQQYLDKIFSICGL
ncbi:glycosyltransferase [bacterium]|nr:glycosyltransferase [bacterium]